MIRKLVFTLSALLALASPALALNCAPLPFTMVNGQPADASQVMADFNNIENCANQNLAHNGANSDITSLSGLTTPLSVSQGGTGSSIAAASAFTTGDVKLTLKTVADPGWIMINDGTIGDISSGATTRANGDTLALYTLVWTNCANLQCPVTGGRGASAAADFSAEKAIALPGMLGRALAVAGSGSGLTARALGFATGAETATIAQANLPDYVLPDPAHFHGFAGQVSGGVIKALDNNSGGAGLGSGGNNTITFSRTDSATTGVHLGGSGTPMSVMQPTTFAVNIEVKL
jgi:hypothetical protein